MSTYVSELITSLVYISAVGLSLGITTSVLCLLTMQILDIFKKTTQ